MSLPDPKSELADLLEGQPMAGGIISDFEEWVKKIKPDMDHVLNLLSQKLSDEPEAIVADLQEIDAWGARMGYFLADANSWVDQALYWFRSDKSDDKTEADRKIILNGQVAYFRKVKEKIESLCSGVKQRMILGSSLLGYYRSTAEFKAKEPPKKYPF